MLDDAPRHKMMANKLKIQVDAGRVENDCESSFITDMHRITTAGRLLTQKQADILERLLERY